MRACVRVLYMYVCIKVDRDAVSRVSLSIDTYLLPLLDINILPRSIYTHFISISRSVDRAKQLRIA